MCIVPSFIRIRRVCPISKIAPCLYTSCVYVPQQNDIVSFNPQASRPKVTEEHLNLSGTTSVVTASNEQEEKLKSS
ncbi:unnamed protein product [Dicrocoelium dendriticum]|nr:unnamed protein product [Dicrocoelium dendriticum]